PPVVMVSSSGCACTRSIRTPAYSRCISDSPLSTSGPMPAGRAGEQIPGGVARVQGDALDLGAVADDPRVLQYRQSRRERPYRRIDGLDQFAVVDFTVQRLLDHRA